jgi:hypothetical protein
VADQATKNGMRAGEVLAGVCIFPRQAPHATFASPAIFFSFFSFFLLATIATSFQKSLKKKLTAFFQLQEFCQRNQIVDSSTTAARLFLLCSNLGLEIFSGRLQVYVLILT